MFWMTIDLKNIPLYIPSTLFISIIKLELWNFDSKCEISDKNERVLTSLFIWQEHIDPALRVKECHKGHQYTMRLLLILQSFWKLEKKKKKKKSTVWR